MGERERTVVEMLKGAKALYGVGNGRKARSMIDAVRDVYFTLRSPQTEGDWRWRNTLLALDKATRSDGRLGGFQVWETEEGRTIEERLAAFDKAVEIASNNES